MLAGYNLRQIPHHFGVQPKTDPLRCDMLRRFLFAHICRNSLFIICSLQNSSYCLLSTISGIFTINALLQQPCVPFHFDKQASFATSTPTNFCLQNHKCVLLFPECNRSTFGINEGNMHSFIEYLMYLPKEKQVCIPYLNGVDMFRYANLTFNTGYTCKMLKTMRS